MQRAHISVSQMSISDHHDDVVLCTACYAVSAVQIWLSYQALWDLQADYLYGKLGSDLECWMKALEDIKCVHSPLAF